MAHREMRETMSQQEALAQLIEDMERVRREFSMACDEDIIEACSFELKALEARCRYLLRMTRQTQQADAQQTDQNLRYSPMTLPTTWAFSALIGR